jgi:hypothetical protein
MFGEDCHAKAFDDDREELCALFREVLLDREYENTIHSLRGEQARGFMQELQDVRFHLRLDINTARRCNCRHSKEVLHCCKKTDFSVPPKEYF